MHQPANAHRIIAEQCLVDQQRMDQHHTRQADQDHAGNQRKPPALIAEESLARLVRQPVDNVAHEGKERHFDHGDERGEDRHADDPRPCAARIIKAKGYQSARGFARRFFGISFESFFKPSEHGDPFTGTLQNFQDGIGTKQEYFRDAGTSPVLRTLPRQRIC